ncbi:phosphatase PAP2 family protein [Anabaena sp. FACHB-1237]|uniref:phosphatase PAP2 family protein n=1 Tax=Anabaena sp. FACHB-1237 TaxID=2692769 RepID=UPI001681BE4D|nr:phosphatase PAP2 family protein [Anabaena sp. FACHB-1237]MBD2136550.1 phosphatase PAP2 family protein [Anabaena sp. FACHB-1237]
MAEENIFKDQDSFRITKNILMSHKTLLIFLGIYLPVQIVGILAVLVWGGDQGLLWDVPVLLAVHSLANSRLDSIAVFLTQWGKFENIFPICVLISVIFLIQKQWKKFSYVIFTALGSAFISHTGKVLIHRIRPHLWISKAPELSYAFPSGHSMTSMTLVAILLILSWYLPQKWLVLTLGSLYILLIAWTRLYLGVHYPSDIIAGWMLAIAWAITMNLIIKPI